MPIIVRVEVNDRVKNAWRNLAADIIGRAVYEYRGDFQKQETIAGYERACAHCQRGFKKLGVNVLYCSGACWRDARKDIEEFFAAPYFEMLADLAGVHPDLIRANLEKAKLPAAWKPVMLEEIELG